MPEKVMCEGRKEDHGSPRKPSALPSPIVVGPWGALGEAETRRGSNRMKSFWTQPLARQAGITALAAALVNGSIILIEWYAVSPVGFEGRSLLHLLMFLIPPFCGSVLAVPVSLFLLVFRKSRQYGITILTCALVYFLIGHASLRFSSSIRMNGFQQIAVRSEPLVNAIFSFAKKEGRPPASLGELAPKYMAKIPQTGMPAYPTYQYQSSTDTNRWHGNPWVLYVNCSSGGINFDMFIYYPLQNYPERGHGGWLERIGKWAYVHE